MSAVRPFEAGDVNAVTALYYRILRHERRTPPQALCDYMREFYLDGPFREADIPSLVHTRDDGSINGFVGVHTVPYIVDGKRLRAAFCGALMVEDHEADPLAGARILKAFLAGPQDISFSETANEVSQSMWERLRGNALSAYSMEWFRPFRPASFGLAFASQKLSALRFLAPVARTADALLARRTTKSNLGFYAPGPANGRLSTVDANPATFADLIRQFSEAQTAYPDWNNGYIEHVIETALDKPGFGKPVLASVQTKSGDPLGCFLYHLKPSGIGRVLQIAAKPKQFGTVLDLLFADAYGRGAAGLRGRSSLDIFEAAPGRSMSFATISATVIHARDPEIAAPFESGDSFLTGLSGERWNRFFGNEFR